MVGGSLSLLGSLIATRKAADSAGKLAALERKRREEQECRTAVSGVLAEIRAILRVVDEPATLTTNTLVAFSMDIWRSSIGAIAYVDPEIERVLQEAYAELALANSLAAQNLHLAYGSGNLNDPYRKHVREMEAGFRTATSGLEEWLHQAASD